VAPPPPGFVAPPPPGFVAPPPPGFVAPPPLFGARPAPPPPSLPAPFPGYPGAPPLAYGASTTPPLLTPAPVAMRNPPLALAAPRLLVAYGEQVREVDRAGFVIGRGKQAGLTIKDPNISRAHATIEQQDGVYYLVDLGSTNGTVVNGQPIQRRPIEEGDVARICDHEIRFSYRRTP
jgi:hypothetical protein